MISPNDGTGKEVANFALENYNRVHATQNKNEWVIVRNSKGRIKQLSEVTLLEYSNMYNTLVPEGSTDVKDLVQKGEKEVLIIRDSHIS